MPAAITQQASDAAALIQSAIADLQARVGRLEVLQMREVLHMREVQGQRG